MEGTPVIRIDKERINELVFEPQEVLADPFERSNRDRLLRMGMILGNVYKNKVQIVFKSLTGTQSVNTTIWATTEKQVVLKGGIFIPVCCIMQVII